MQYRQSQGILLAIKEVERWISIEGSPPKPAAIARELVKIGRNSGGTKQSALLAAFGLLAGGLEINADNIAWLIQDGRLGYPPSPPLDL